MINIMRKFSILFLACMASVFASADQIAPAENSPAAQESNSENTPEVSGPKKLSPEKKAEIRKKFEEVKKKMTTEAHGAEEVLGVREIDSKQREEAFDLKVKLFKFLKSIENKFPFLRDLFKSRIFGVWTGGLIGAALVMAFTWIFQRYIADTIFKLLARAFDKANANSLKEFFSKLSDPTRAFIMLLGINFGLMLVIEDPAKVVVEGRIFWGVANAIGFWAIWRVCDFTFNVITDRLADKHKTALNLIDLGRRVTKSAMIFFGVLVALDMCGANIGAIVASLGIGGAALAFASKDTIANFFGSISLVADRPFSVGDWIVTDSIEGIVEGIGIRSTKIRTFPKTLVTIPNSLLANIPIDNWSKMNLRRVKMTIGLTYSSSTDQMLGIVKDIEKILSENKEVDSGTFIVNFTDFGPSSLDITVIYYCKRIDAKNYNATRQAVNLEIMEAVEKRGLSFAFPSSSVYLETPVKIAREKDD